MNESPIMFIDEMVRAIAAGAKDTTRRVCPFACQVPPDAKSFAQEEGRKAAMRHAHKPGDLLWVRQSMLCSVAYKRLPRGKNGQPVWPGFSAQSVRNIFVDKNCVYTHVLSDQQIRDALASGDYVRMNKMFMPRWASRLELRVTSVSIERLSDMTDDEARREGFRAAVPAGILPAVGGPHLDAFMATWDKIHKAAKHPKYFDPMLFVYRFEVAGYTRQIKSGDEWVNPHYRMLLA